MIHPRVHALCLSDKSVSAELARDPRQEPGEICKKLFHANIEEDVAEHWKRSHDKDKEPSEADVAAALECGKWGGTKPSELFLKIYHNVLNTLEDDTLVDVCSPSLIGSHGYNPLLVISTIPDIARHMSNLIARAEHEVYLATNFWQVSEPSKLICNALKEMSRRCGERGTRGVVKIVYDRGSAKQIIRNHQHIGPAEYADLKGKVQIPPPEELPNLDLEVVNYHRPMLGTFHAKFMIVDRKIAICQSDNIQDNDNLEFMCQFEGPIVDSIYDTAIITFHNTFNPPLLCLKTPAAASPPPSFDMNLHSKMFDQTGKSIHEYHISNKLNDDESTLTDAVDTATSKTLPQHTSTDAHYDPDTASEMLRSISAMNPSNGESRNAALSRHLNTEEKNDTKASGPEASDASDIFTPIIPFARHEAFPIAMVNRPPFGNPAPSSLYVPQNVAWICALRYARSDVFIQTPDLNAAALLPEIVAACRRGIKVSYIYCLGYNDAGELLPLQGGHNEGIAHRLYKDLEEQYHANLDIYCYVAKDQDKPLHNKTKRRSCHIKLMIVDGHIGIMGSGNQDTQSWYHSQEINVMVDSELVVGKWMEGIRRNQNSFKFGQVRKGNANEDKLVGCWVDANGQMAEHSIGVDAGKFAWAKGIVGAVDRVRGVGGF